MAALFLPALRLGAEPELAARLHELASWPARDGADGAARTPAPPDAAPGQDAATRTPTTWPRSRPPSHQVERAGALAGLRDLVASERRVTMCGLPGVGKTSLAAAAGPGAGGRAARCAG